MSDDPPDEDHIPDIVDSHSRWLQSLREDIWALEETVTDLQTRLTNVENIVNPDPGRVQYEQLTRAQKVHRVRRALVEEAARSTTDKAALDYDDIRWLFDGHPSPGHCYDLMEDAAKLAGFKYDDTTRGEYRIRVNLGVVNDDALIHAANKATNPNEGESA